MQWQQGKLFNVYYEKGTQPMKHCHSSIINTFLKKKEIDVATCIYNQNVVTIVRPLIYNHTGDFLTPTEP